MNCGLTRFNRGSYTLSLWSVSPRESPQTSSLLGIPPSFIAVWGRSATRQRSLLDYAQPAAVGLRGRTEHNLGYAASATRRAETLRAARLPDLSSAIKIFPFLRSRASGVHPTTSACNRIRYRPMSTIFYTLFPDLSTLFYGGMSRRTGECRPPLFSKAAGGTETIITTPFFRKASRWRLQRDLQASTDRRVWAPCGRSPTYSRTAA